MTTDAAPTRNGRPGASGTGWGHPCPVDPSHGRLLAWAGSERWGWFCPNQAHDGDRDHAATPAFFTTTEAESGVTTASRSSSDLVPPGPDRSSSEASTGHAAASSSSGPVIAPASAEGGPFATHGATSPGHNRGPVSRPAPGLAAGQTATSRGRSRSSDRADQLTTLAPA
jgi:hypothetical protein